VSRDCDTSKSKLRFRRNVFTRTSAYPKRCVRANGRRAVSSANPVARCAGRVSGARSLAIGGRPGTNGAPAAGRRYSAEHLTGGIRFAGYRSNIPRSSGSIVALTGVRISKKTARRSTVSAIVRWRDLAHGTVVAGATYPVSIRSTYHSTSRSRAVEGVNSGRFTPSTAYVATASSCKRSTIDPEDPHSCM
jgi:hypothetical protein